MARTPVSKLRRCALTTTALAGSLTLSACFGSGGSGFGNLFFNPGTGFRSGGGGAPIASYEADPEYQAMSGLGVIGASTYYNGGSNTTGYTGSGVIVAVIDTGIDVDHPDLVDALHPGSQSVVGGSVDDIAGHGTAVAGVVGASRNGFGMHGVAFNSTILALRAERCIGVFCGFFPDDLTASTNVAVSLGADIINYSLGGPSPSTLQVQTAMINAVNQNTVLVAAAGNEFLNDPIASVNPLYPAGHAIDPQMNGQMIVAGAYDENTLDIASFSNRAGIAADFYLMAPGVDIFTTQVGGGFANINGSSFSAPMISGAAALLKERYPALSASQIVDILLVSATDLGAVGTDPIYGRGLLNLAAAALPLGTLSIPATSSVDGGGSSPDDTVMTLSAAFGDALAGSSALANAMFLDGYGRDYAIDLTASVSTPSAGPDLLGFLSGYDHVERFETDLSPHTRIRVQSADADGEQARWLGAPLDDEPADASFSLRQRIAEGAEVTIARGQGAGGQFGLYGVGAPIGGGMLGASDTAFIGMADSGGNATVSTAAGERLLFQVGIGVDEATLGQEVEGSAGGASVYIAEMTHADESGMRIGIQLGRLIEDGSLLETGGDGGFALNGSATTDFVSAFGVVPLTERVELFGSYTTGRSDADSLATDLVRDFNGVRSESMSLGIAGRELLSDRDRVAFTLTRPLRVTDGSATVTVPVSRTLDGAVNFAHETVGLTPSGQETDAELSYGFALSPQEHIDFNFLTRLEPDHVQDASPEFSAGLRYRLSF